MLVPPILHSFQNPLIAGLVHDPFELLPAIYFSEIFFLNILKNRIEVEMASHNWFQGSVVFYGSCF